MKVLIDADCLVALAKKDDSNHAKALSIAKKLEKSTLYISPFSIPEAATVISHQVSQKAAVAFLTEARKRKLYQLPLTYEIEKETDGIFISQKTKGISWPDCLNMAFFRKYSFDSIFSFDKIYSKNGYPIESPA